MGKLSGMTAIVTGGASGMGRGVALNFAEEGANVAVLIRKIIGPKAKRTIMSQAAKSCPSSYR